MTPVVDRLEQRFESSVTVIRVDAGASGARSVLESLRVRGHPTVVVFDGNQAESARFTGVVGEEEIAEALDAAAPR